MMWRQEGRKGSGALKYFRGSVLEGIIVCLGNSSEAENDFTPRSLIGFPDKS